MTRTVWSNGGALTLFSPSDFPSVSTLSPHFFILTYPCNFFFHVDLSSLPLGEIVTDTCPSFIRIIHRYFIRGTCYEAEISTTQLLDTLHSCLWRYTIFQVVDFFSFFRDLWFWKIYDKSLIEFILLIDKSFFFWIYDQLWAMIR